LYADLNNDNDGQIYLNIDGKDNAVGMGYWDGSRDWQGTADNSFNLNQWHHVAGRYDGSSIQPFIDGSPSTGDNESGATAWENYGPYIGAGYQATQGNNKYAIDGVIDDLRVYNTALSDAQIASIYEATKP